MVNKKLSKKVIRCGLIGYGAIFNCGKFHGLKIQAMEGLELKAAFSQSRERTNAARLDFPEIEIYNSISSLLEQADIDLAVVITPHHTHASIVLACLQAGKHVLLINRCVSRL